MNSKNKGFTLIELLAVIVLLAIVGIVGANLIITRLNKAKADTMINDFMDLQKEIAYKSMNDDICGNKNFGTEFVYKKQDDGNFGFYLAYDCTSCYDINSDDYKLLLMYGADIYDNDGKEWTSGDKYKYYTNTNNEKVLLTREDGKYYYYDKTTSQKKEVTNLEGWKVELNPNYLRIQFGATKKGKFKNVSFNKEQIKKICEASVKGECKVSTNHKDVKAFIDVTREL